mmetsp:Transcript_98826/g.250830  ORF Transcript_98826/g.250830 Transcript_98826/m.250830 type:complete len:405 (+) Transcript_98826:99-1313(+)
MASMLRIWIVLASALVCEVQGSLRVVTSAARSASASGTAPAVSSGSPDQDSESEDAAPACSCDCCIAQQARSGLAGSVCVPRIEGAAAAAGLASGCQAICGVPEDERAMFEARSPEVDYSRYCPAFCISLGTDDWAAAAPQSEAMLCAAKASFASAGPGRHLGLLGQPGAPVAVAAESVWAPSPAASASLMETEVSDAVLALAKGEMMEARRHAMAAGMSAKSARQSYEDVLAAGQKYGKEVGQGVLQQIQQAAAEQAGEAVRLRLRWEEAIRVKARAAGVRAAGLYEQAQLRDVMMAGTWSERSDQFRAAELQEESAATQAGTQAQLYRDAGDSEGADVFYHQAETAVALSKRYAKEAEAAKEQSAAISKNSEVYTVAIQAASARAQWANTPKDVPPDPSLLR